MSKVLFYLKNHKIGILIISLFLAIFYIISLDLQSSKLNADISESNIINPNILVTQGQAIVNRNKIIKLKKDEKLDLQIGDKIRTMEDSSATIFWPDGSITRLSEKTAITINELKVKKDLSGVQIKFDTEVGKTWSNIVKFIGRDSYFVETYDFGNYAATVRGTVFEINIDDNYAHSVNHNIFIEDTSNGSIYNVPEGEARNLHDLSTRVPDEVQDQDWIDKNLQEDSIYLQELAKKWNKKLSDYLKGQNFGINLINNLKKNLGFGNDYIVADLMKNISSSSNNSLDQIKGIIPSLSPKEKYKLNQELTQIYQNINPFNDDEIISSKTQLRQMIVDTSSGNISALQDDFARLDLYDYLDTIKNKNENAKKILKSSLDDYFNNIKDTEKLKGLFGNFSADMLSIIGVDFGELQDEISIIKQKLGDKDFQNSLKKQINEKAQEINNEIDKIVK